MLADVVGYSILVHCHSLLQRWLVRTLGRAYVTEPGRLAPEVPRAVGARRAPLRDVALRGKL
jgi:hypothetical protein